MTLYYVVLTIFLIGFLLIYRIIHSPFGQVPKAIRENEPRAISLGYKIDQYKLMAFVLSAALSGTAGATKRSSFSSPHSPTFTEHVGRSGADDAARRARHRVRTGRRRRSR